MQWVSKDVMDFMMAATPRGTFDPAEYRRLMVERIANGERGCWGVPGSIGFAKVCAKVVAEGEFDGGVVDSKEVECELGGRVMTEFLREAATHGWVVAR